MTTSSNFIDINVRPRRSRGLRSSKKSILYSDYNGEEDTEDVNLGQRSISLTALPHGGGGGGPGSTATAPTTTTTSGPVTATTPTTTLEPRMAQLETLEAKMASIEVSLSTAPRRKNGKKSVIVGPGQLIAKAASSALSNSPCSAMSILASVRSNTLIDTCRELEVLRNALKDKENTIQNLQGQVNCCGRLTSPQPFDSSERRIAELRLQTLRQEEETRKAAIKRINLTLEQMDETESNIDVRIRQAELEYELGREELGLLGVREEMRSLQARLDAKPMPTLYSCVSSSGRSSLHCVQIEYDPKSPRFGAGNPDDKMGLFVLWAAEDSGLQKGDRILEVNGKMTLSTSKEEMNRLLTVCPSRAEIVVNRPWTPPPSAEDFLRRENLRLTHRISYLEDQVAELLIQKEKTASSVPVKLPKYEKKQMEVFQKGPQVTVLQTSPDVAKTEPHLTTVTISSSPRVNGDVDSTVHQNGTGPRSHRCNISVGPSEKYHEVDGYHGYPPTKLHNGSDKIKALSKKYEKDEFSSTLAKSKSKHDGEEDGADHRLRSAKVTVKNSIPVESNYSLSDLEKPTRKGNSYYSRVVDYSSETSCVAPYRPPHKDRSVKSLDLDDDGGRHSRNKSDFSHHHHHHHHHHQVDGDAVVENGKPAPPKKPIRLTIQRATSLQSVETGYSLHNAIRKMKRSHKSEAPQPPGLANGNQHEHGKVNGSGDGSVNGDVHSSRTSSRAESWVNHSDSGQSPFRWPGHHHRSRGKTSEKWC